MLDSNLNTKLARMGGNGKYIAGVLTKFNRGDAITRYFAAGVGEGGLAIWQKNIGEGDNNRD